MKDLEKLQPAWAVFADDNSFLARCDNDSIRRWNIESGQQRCTFQKIHVADGLLGESPNARHHDGRRRAIDLLAYPPRIPNRREKENIQSLLMQLDDDSYETREAASKKFLAIGMLAEPDLRRTLKETTSVEVRIRCRRLLDEISAKPNSQLSGNTGDVEALAFSLDGQLFAAGGRAGNLLVWRISDLKELMRLTPDNP